MTFLFSLFWFVRTTKFLLFSLYLWQLKEYHIGRFLDHFRTEKGKRLLLNKANLIKIGLVFLFLFYLLLKRSFAIKDILYWFFGILFLLYIFETLLFLKNVFQKNIKIPVLTKKSAVLIFFAVFVEIVFLLIAKAKTSDIYYFSFWLLLFDIFSLGIGSTIVLSFQPITVLIRNSVIKKATQKRNQFKSLIVIGITGSYGKTTTKEFLATILSQKFKTLKTKKHRNSEMGISRCILEELSPEHQVFVVEMGAYGKGGIKLLADIVKPKIGIVTGVNQQHLALFRSMENLISAEGGIELAQALPSDGTIVLNQDNEIIRSKIKGQITKLQVRNQRYYSTKTQADIWAENTRVEKEYVSFRVLTKEGESADFRINVLGGHNVSNLLAAILVAKELGMSLKEISKACEKDQTRTRINKVY